jgi:hypothetical protein
MKKAICILLAVSVMCTMVGCTSVRRKFVRDKKSGEEPVYLALREYPTVPERSLYQTYYAYVNGWLEELAVQIEQGSNRKRMRKSIDQVTENLDQLTSYYNEVGRSALAPLRMQIQQVHDAVYDPYFMRSMGGRRIADMVRDVKREFMSHFDYDSALAWMEGNSNDAD